jgi:exopolysaccharide production protein ExoQ
MQSPLRRNEFPRFELRPNSGPRTFGVRHALFCGAAVVLMFCNDGPNALVFQVLGVALFIFSATIFFIMAPHQPLTLAPIDIVMLFSVPISYLAAVLSQDGYSLMHTTMFLLVYVSVIVIAQRIGTEELVDCVRASTIAIFALVTLTFGDTLLTSLVPGAARRWELREAPFGMHPNLAGFVYGGFLVMAANSYSVVRRYNRFLTLVIIALCFAVMVVASARGGLLAVAVTLAVYGTVEVFNTRRSGVYILIIGFAVIMLSFIYWDKLFAYATEMFDLDSEQRGLGSGGTGRVDIWIRGIDFIFTRSWEIFIGSGMRTSGYMGFPAESSYITLAVESGLFLTAIILISLMNILHICFRQQAAGSAFHRFAFYALVFAMFQSVFNRYLIAIGNPFSLLIFLIASKASPRLRLRRRWPDTIRQGRLDRTSLSQLKKPN